MTLYGNLIVYSTDTFSEHMSNKSISTLININGNICYEGILKHRKYRYDSSVVFLFTVNRDEGIAHELFSFKIILRSP